MFDFAWSELTVIGIVALIVIGPKDLPRALRAAGQVIRRGRALAREFQNTFEEVIREAELDEIRDNMRKTMAGLEVTETRSIAPPPAVAPATPGERLQPGLNAPVSYDIVHDPDEPIEWLDLDDPKPAEPAVAHETREEPLEAPKHLGDQPPEHPPAP